MQKEHGVFVRLGRSRHAPWYHLTSWGQAPCARCPDNGGSPFFPTLFRKTAPGRRSAPCSRGLAPPSPLCACARPYLPSHRICHCRIYIPAYMFVLTVIITPKRTFVNGGNAGAAKILFYVKVLTSARHYLSRFCLSGWIFVVLGLFYQLSSKCTKQAAVLMERPPVA